MLCHGQEREHFGQILIALCQRIECIPILFLLEPADAVLGDAKRDAVLGTIGISLASGLCPGESEPAHTDVGIWTVANQSPGGVVILPSVGFLLEALCEVKGLLACGIAEDLVAHERGTH